MSIEYGFLTRERREATCHRCHARIGDMLATDFLGAIAYDLQAIGAGMTFRERGWLCGPCASDLAEFLHPYFADNAEWVESKNRILTAQLEDMAAGHTVDSICEEHGL